MIPKKGNGIAMLQDRIAELEAEVAEYKQANVLLAAAERELMAEVERLKDLVAKHEQIEEYFDNTPIEEVKEGYYELECKRLRSALEMAKNLYAGLCESAIEYHTPSELRVSSEVLAKLGEVLQQALYIIGPNIKGVE